MNAIDYILIGALALVVGGVIAYLIKRKKSGKGGCGCGCANCPSAGVCHGKATKVEKEDDQAV